MTNLHTRNLPAEHVGTNGSLAVYEAGSSADYSQDDIDLRALWRVIVRYRRLIVFLFCVILGLALLAHKVQRPVYSASGLIEINTGGRNLVKFQNLETERISSREHLSTQAKILSSKALAREVVAKLNLANESEFNGATKQRSLANGVKALKTLLGGDQQVSEESMHKRAVSYYRSNLSISPVRNSTLLSVRFSSFDPELSAKIVNQHMQSYIWLSSERRIDSTSGAKDFLETQITDVQSKLVESEKRLTDFGRQNQVIDMENDDNIVMSRLTRLSDSLSRVQSLRIDASTSFEQAQNSDPMTLSVVSEDALVKSLREERAKLKSQYLELSKVYKPKYPELVELNARIDQLDSSISKQANTIIAILENTFLQLLSREKQIEAELEEARSEVFDLQDRAVKYNIYKREWEANKELYAGLLERTKEVGVAAGMELNIASVVDSATEPGSPSSAGLGLTLFMASALGLLAGLGATFLLALLDNAVNDVQQLRRVTRLNHLGVVPQVGKKSKAMDEPLAAYALETLTYHQPRSLFSESIQALRASLSHSVDTGCPKSILVTSATPGEGKSTIAMNLGVAFASAGKQVIVIDADLRRSGYDAVFDIPSKPGLTDYLKGDIGLVPFDVKEIDNLSLLVSGKTADNPSDLIGSIEMRKLIKKLTREYEVVIIDSPPVLSLADSVMLSTMVDAVLFAVAASTASQDAIKNALQRLRLVNAPLIGTVFSNAEVMADSYSQQYYSDAVTARGVAG